MVTSQIPADAGGPCVRGRRGVAIGLAAVIGTGLVYAPPATAKDPDDRRRARVLKQIDKSQAVLADLSAEARRAVLALQRTQEAVKVAQAALAKAKQQVVVATARKVKLDAALVKAKAEEAQAEEVLRQIRVRIEIGEARRNEMARIAYEGGNNGQLMVLLAGGTARELSERLYFVEKANERQNQVLDELAVARTEAQAAVVRLATVRRQIAGLNEQARAAMIEAQNAQAAGARAQAELVRLAAVQKRQAADAAARRAGELKRLQSLQAESDRLAARLRARAMKSGGRFFGGSGAIAAPVNAPINSGFGMRYHPILHYSRLHSGIDFGAPCGAPVYAARAGTVISAGWSGGYGNQIVIEHGGPLATTYNHLSSISKGSGQVARGELIGYVGTSGLSTGCHLHFEVRLNGNPVNPRGYM